MNPSAIRAALRTLVAVIASSSLAGCGYHLANEVKDPLGPFVIASAPLRVPYAEGVAAAEAGARAELARAGQLGCSKAASECATLVVEIVRVDEQSEGVALDRAGLPIARGLRITVVGRALVRTGDVDQRATGDMSTTEVVASELGVGSPREVEVARAPLADLGKAEAIRRGARRLGERLVRRILGAPEPTAE